MWPLRYQPGRSAFYINDENAKIYNSIQKNNPINLQIQGEFINNATKEKVSINRTEFMWPDCYANHVVLTPRRPSADPKITHYLLNAPIDDYMLIRLFKPIGKESGLVTITLIQKDVCHDPLGIINIQPVNIF